MRSLTLRAASSAAKKRTSHDMPRSAARKSWIFNYRGKSTSCVLSALLRACLANAVVNNVRTELAASFVQSINISANCFVCLKCFDLRYFEFKALASGQSLMYRPKSNYQALLLVTWRLIREFDSKFRRSLRSCLMKAPALQKLQMHNMPRNAAQNKNAIFNYRSKWTSRVLSALRLSQNSKFRWSLKIN